ncbi:hypothetical protein [Vibrio algarum]|uniref:Uncharacterized protein n=1 Tax=Vibrio algarum TaxID=3020714 RepID=A0ABT4YME6_9VIBR|nr:hypothetical protein [Vibrio sp. KJ40-1]MDB1122690.1 hypothetical protein [Vibrio sp. KJ40-1]
MSRTTIVYLTHQKVLSPINSPKTINYMLFDIKEVSRFTTKLSSEPSVISTSHAEKKVSIESLIDKISLFDIEDRYDLGILIEVIVKSDIPQSIEENTSLCITSLLFDRDLLLEELEVAFINSIQKEYSKVKIGKVCGLNEAQYFAFRELLGQDTALREGQHRYISHNALRDFFESHILINRWCLIRDLDIDDVVAKLNDSKISFAYPSLLKHGIFIIPKSSSHLL